MCTDLASHPDNTYLLFYKQPLVGNVSVASLLSTGSMSDRYVSTGHSDSLPFLSKLESLAGSAVRAAGKVEADLIVVYTATGEKDTPVTAMQEDNAPCSCSLSAFDVKSKGL